MIIDLINFHTPRKPHTHASGARAEEGVEKHHNNE
jgi:hypothetical protein